MTMIRRFTRCTKGAAAAEMALIAPFAVLLLFTTLEAGHWLYAQHQVVKGLRDGARFAARQSFDVMDCASGSITDATVLSRVRHLTRTGELSGGTSRVTGWDDGEITVTIDCTNVDSSIAETGIYDSGDPARKVIVTTTFPYDSLFNGIGVLNDSSVNLNGTQEAAAMGI
mgnify:CR=1 FL=1